MRRPPSDITRFHHTTMNFLQLVEQRCSVRQYSDTPVSAEQIDYLLACMRLAPSAVNLQPWHFYVVQSEEAKARLRQCYHREWFASAPLYIIGCIRHDQEWVRRRDQKPHGDIDIAIATEHLCLAATELGLGTCWVCNFDAALCHDLFQMDAQEEPAVLIPIGHPAPEVKPASKERKPLTDIITTC